MVKPLKGKSGARALKSTTPLEGAWSGVLHAAQGFLNEAERRRKAFLDKGDAEDLHRYRVGVRRARAALGAGKGLIAERRLDLCRVALAGAMKGSNRLRDLDVKCLVFPEIAKELPKSLEGGAMEFLGVIRRERDKEAVKVRGEFQTLDVSLLLDGVRGAKVTGDAELGELVRNRVIKLVRRIVRQSGELTPDDSEERWHEIRIEGKKVRYLLEAFGDFFSKGRAKKALAPLVRLQEALGDLNDNAMQKAFLRDPVWREPMGSGLARCLGAIEVLLEQRGVELRRRARRALERFRKEGGEMVKGLK